MPKKQVIKDFPEYPEVMFIKHTICYLAKLSILFKNVFMCPKFKRCNRNLFINKSTVFLIFNYAGFPE